MKYLVLSMGIACSTMATAGIKVDDCNLDIPYDISINQKEVSIRDKTNTIMRVDADDRLFINQTAVDLSPKQQQLVKEMGREYRAMVPTIGNIASDAVGVALKAVTMTMGAVLVDDMAFQQDVNARLDKVSEKIKSKFNASFYNGQAINDGAIDDLIDEDLDAIISDIVEKSSGRIVAKALGQIFSGDEEEIKDLEFKMEMFEQDLEAELASQAEKIEQEAKKFCVHLKRIDKVETQLQQEVAEFSSINIVQ
ncbi:MAG: DUF2884 family protein [Gammaproteobacteria bacterium]|nr:DUF2884 family protein [Gammaproteobacteria bacterium]